MSAPRYDTKWWGWGPAERQPELTPAQLELLGAELGELEPAPPVELAAVAVPEARPLPDAVLRAVGADAVLVGVEDRVRRSAGMSYPDLFRLRSGELGSAPDAVLLPADAAEVAAVLEACSAERVAVVPFGGGTSVVGGIDPYRDGFERLVSLDLSRMRGVEVDHVALTARLGPGLRAPEAEAALGAAGVTLGHFPQSYEYATIGGLRGDALRGPGVERLRALRRAGDLGPHDRPGGRALDP